MNKKFNDASSMNIFRTYNLVGIFLLIAVLVKLFYIFYMTMRGNEHGYPFDTYVFHAPDRFVDYLGSRAWALESNPWDPNHPMLKNLQAAPYGPVSFYYMRYMGFVEPLIQFMLLIFGFIFINYKTFSASYIQDYDYIKPLLFIVILVGFYPLHFIIDRGNIEALPALLFSILIYFGGVKKSKSMILDFCIVLIATCKFVWFPILAITLFFPIKRMFIILFSTFVIYIYPIVFNGVTLKGYALTIVNSYKVSGWALNFSHNIFHGIQMIGEFLGTPVGEKFILFSAIVGIFFILVPYALLLKNHFLKVKASNTVIYLFMCHIALCTLIFSNPSFDYRLIYFLPIYFYVMYVITKTNIGSYLPNRLNSILTISFVCSVCWFNFFIGKDAYSWYMPIRAFSILIFDLVILYIMIRINSNQVNIDDHL